MFSNVQDPCIVASHEPLWSLLRQRWKPICCANIRIFLGRKKNLFTGWRVIRHRIFHLDFTLYVGKKAVAHCCSFDIRASHIDAFKWISSNGFTNTHFTLCLIMDLSMLARPKNGYWYKIVCMIQTGTLCCKCLGSFAFLWCKMLVMSPSRAGSSHSSS